MMRWWWWYYESLKTSLSELSIRLFHNTSDGYYIYKLYKALIKRIERCYIKAYKSASRMNFPESLQVMLYYLMNIARVEVPNSVRDLVGYMNWKLFKHYIPDSILGCLKRSLKSERCQRKRFIIELSILWVCNNLIHTVNRL